MKGRLEDLGVFYVSQSYFGLQRQSIRNNSDRIILFKQTLRDIESVYHAIGAYDMLYSEITEKCHKICSERFFYPCIDSTENTKVNMISSMKPKTHISIVFVKLNLFSFFHDVSN